MIPHRKRVQSLLSKRGRREHHQFLIEGVRLVEEALAANLSLERLYHIPAPPGTRLADVIERARQRDVHLAEVTPDELLSLSDTQTPQGVIGVADVPRWSDKDVWLPDSMRAARGTGDLLILDGVRDPGNLGTLIRTAEAAGARGILLTRGTVEFTNPKVVRSAMGAMFRLPILEMPPHDEVARRCREAGLPLILTSAHAGDAPTCLQRHEAVALVLGGEAEGADPAWEPVVDFTVRLPMSPEAESINVAVAGAILLFRHIWDPANGTR